MNIDNIHQVIIVAVQIRDIKHAEIFIERADGTRRIVRKCDGPHRNAFGQFLNLAKLG